ncbi:hypothetical protein Poli38472_009409 [Pythium oligandrum]|uniref:TRP C-terminal domain-containing protein n=1 Tax=Pythium oligandrum TaxID=41045 RepID=A0A8K1CKP2_PYTOL|nr:hypothetical protein Poli38472_009409 [Pythium oligandrum]|eukprot:TMW65242.1 hypothetical protein Poli38472_009409 [Pythium oligandrum]
MRVMRSSVVATVTLLGVTTARPTPPDAIVDVQLDELPHQVQNGPYKQVSEELYVRQLEHLGVYFTLQRQTSKWTLSGYQCVAPETEQGGVCEQIAQSEVTPLAVNVGEHPVPYLVHPSTVSHGRQLQFSNPGLPEPPLIDGMPVYYNCGYSGANDWCCSEFNAAAGGANCWNLNTCTEDYMFWSGQNMICCSGNMGSCVLTYQPPMPATPAPPPSSASPTSAPPFSVITASPTTTAPPATSPPSTPEPSTEAPTPPPTTEAPTPPPTPPPTTKAPTPPPTPPPTVAPTPPPTPPPTTEAPTPPPTTETPTPPPTTEAPTPPPTTEAPTPPPTPPPTTEAPTLPPTPPPTTEAPTPPPTPPPTTEAPTPPPTTPPTTEAPTSSPTPPPTTEAPTPPPAQPPTTEAPTTPPPPTEAPTPSPAPPPTTEAPTAPPTPPPTTEAPTPPPTPPPTTESPTEAPPRPTEGSTPPPARGKELAKRVATGTGTISSDMSESKDSSGSDHSKRSASSEDTEEHDENAADLAHLEQSLVDLADATRHLRERISESANILVATAVTVNVVSSVITAVTSGTAAVSSVASITSIAIAGSQGLLHIATGPLSQGFPAADLSGLLMMLNYLQFIAAGSHLSLPGAPDFFFEFTDSLGWSHFQPISRREAEPEGVSSQHMGNFSAAEGDIIAGVLAYAERLNVQPEELFTKTIIAFGTVVGSVAAVVAILYALVRCVARKRLELVIQRLKDLPRAKLLLRLLTQSCLSVCLMSEYALSMTSSFQMRYYQQNTGGYGAFATATVALIVVCFGLIVLGVVKLWNKSEKELSDPDFKFAWGAYYKYYRFESRYFFVAKMGAEILSGVIIGLVSDVPSQLTLLMGLQLSMFLYTVESAPYSVSFQTFCSSTAFVMKMITYALISSFLTPSTDVGMRDCVGTLVIVLQVTLLLLFNSRQLHILYKQVRYLWALRQQTRQLKRLEQAERDEQNAMMLMMSTSTALTPTYDTTPAEFGLLKSKRNAMTVAAPPPPLPVAAA